MIKAISDYVKVDSYTLRKDGNLFSFNSSILRIIKENRMNSKINGVLYIWQKLISYLEKFISFL